MKKASLLIAGFFILMNLFTPAIAQTTKTATSIIPASMDMVFEYNMANKNLLSDFLSAKMESSMTLTGDEEWAKSIFTDNTFTAAFDINAEDSGDELNGVDVVIAFYLKPEYLEKMLTSMQSEYTSETYNNQKIYSTYQAYSVYLDSIFAFTDDKEIAKQMIDNYANGATSLASDQQYQNAQKYRLDGSFLNMYIKLADLMEVYKAMLASEGLSGAALNTISQEFIDAIIAENFSISQRTDGFDFTVYVEGDTEKLNALGMPFDSYNFVPSLYKKLSGDNLIAYAESSNFSKSFEDSLKAMSTDSDFTLYYETFLNNFKKATTVDFAADILPLLDKNYMFTLHKTTQVYPGATLMFDVNENKAAAVAKTAILNAKLKEYMLALEKESGKNFYSSSQITVGTDKLDQHIINLKPILDENSIATTAEMKLYLTIGVTSDGKLVMTTHPDFAGIYPNSTGLLSNAKLAALFKNPDEEISQIGYFDLDNVGEYVHSLMSIFEAPEYSIKYADKLFAPWHSLYMKSYATEHTSWAEGSLNADIALFDGYAKAYDEYYAAEREANRINFINTAKPFCDVTTADWYSPYTNALKYEGIISGYYEADSYNPCFHPNEDITRAEFLKMLSIIAKRTPLTYNTNAPTFSDLDENEWSTSYIQWAAQYGIVNGYSDLTFRPHANITRAEALEMLKNAILKINAMGNNYAMKYDAALEPFADVEMDDWFYDAVARAYNNKFVSGTTETTFEPNRNINRAEAAKLIYNFFELSKTTYCYKNPAECSGN